MAESQAIPDEVQLFAKKTGATNIRETSNGNGYRVYYGEGSSEIIHLGQDSDIPDGYHANLSFAVTPSIDLFP